MAIRAPINVVSGARTRFFYQLEYRLIPLLIAICTYPMNWIGAACIRFQNISKGARPHFLQVIALLLSFPCFEVSHLLFKFAYLLQKRRALLLRRKCGIIGIDNLRLEFDELSL